MRRSILLVVLVMAVAAFLIAPPIAPGQTTKPAPAEEEDRQVLRALLEEMRQLRRLLQRTQVFSLRLQVTLERIRLQQAHVDLLMRSLESVRARLAEIRAARPRMEEENKEMDELMRLAADSKRRDEMEAQVKEIKGRLGVLAREEEQSRQREVDLVAGLQSAQAKLSDLQNQLDNMMRELEAP